MLRAAAAPLPSLWTSLTFFRASPDNGFALRGSSIATVSSFLLPFSWNGTADVLSPLIEDLAPCAG